MSVPTRILIADDHPLFREALRHVINTKFQSADIVEARTYMETLRTMRDARRFDLVFADLIMPGSSESFEELAELLSLATGSTKVIVVSSREDWPTIRRVMSLGAVAFIPKSAAKAEMERAIHRVLAGDTYMPDEPLGRSVNRALHGSRTQLLTPRQVAVLEQLARGSSNREIARDLNIEEITVKAHISAILRKLHVKNRLEAVVVSHSLGE